MEFALSEDQGLLQQSVSGILAEASPLDSVRRVAAGDDAARIKVASAVDGLGLSGMLVPERFGGLGLGLLDAVIVQEAFGKAVAPVPFMGRSVMSAIAIRAAASEAQQAIWLGGMARGEVRFAVAIGDRVGVREGDGVTETGGRLSGKTLFAMETDGATHVLVVDRTGKLHVVDLADPGITQTPLETIDRTRTTVEFVFEGVEADGLCAENERGASADAAISAGRLLIAADTMGAAQAMLDQAVAYSLERKQFGRPIGSFQAVKHMCAEMAAALEPARALVWHAAHAVDGGLDEADVMVCLARSHLAEVGTFIARTATEVHGGMGFTDLLGLHYWFKRIGANRQWFGGPERVRAEAARLQGWA